MSDYSILPVISKSGRHTRYVVRKGDKFLTEYELYFTYYEWVTKDDLENNRDKRFNDYKFFRTRRGALKTAERLDRIEFRQAKNIGLKDWNHI